MRRNTMPLPRIPDLSLPSFRELDESIEASRQNLPHSCFTHNGYEGRGHSTSPSPSTGSTLPGPFPPYPAGGWHIPPDPSQNAFQEQGFSNQNTVPGTNPPKPNTAVDKDQPSPGPEGLPLRPKRNDSSPTNTQSSLSSAQRIIRKRMSSSSPTLSPSELPSHPPRPALGDRHLPNPPIPAREPSNDPAPNRVQRRRISVSFSDVAAHTAKCDECNRRNRNGMTRCQTCGWQLCRKCQADRNGDRTHGSIGAIHVAKGLTPLPPAVNDNKSRSAGSTEDVRAAQTLLELGSFDARSPSVADRGIREDVPQSQDEEQDAVLTDSEMTLSIGEDGEWPQGDEDDIPIGEDGLPIGYVITRRNPVRAARPSKMKE